MKEMQALKTVIVSPDSLINKNYAELRERVNWQEQILARQQQFLEALDRREREANIVVLRVPDDNEAMEGATTDQEKLNRLWTKSGLSGVAASHRRLGGNVRTVDESTPGRSRPILHTLQNKDQSPNILDSARRLKDDKWLQPYIYYEGRPS